MIAVLTKLLNHTNNQPGRVPVVAAVLSVWPGLGQLYNGQNLKAVLFMDVWLCNFALFMLVLFAQPFAKISRQTLASAHVQFNESLFNAVSSVNPSAPFLGIWFLLMALFAAYAIRDAHDYANNKSRQEICPGGVLGIAEASSGSYLLHGASVISFAIVAVFSLIPGVNSVQEMQIVFSPALPSAPESAAKQVKSSDVAPIKPDLYSDHNENGISQARLFTSKVDAPDHHGVLPLQLPVKTNRSLRPSHVPRVVLPHPLPSPKHLTVAPALTPRLIPVHGGSNASPMPQLLAIHPSLAAQALEHVAPPFPGMTRLNKPSASIEAPPLVSLTTRTTESPSPLAIPTFRAGGDSEYEPPQPIRVAKSLPVFEGFAVKPVVRFRATEEDLDHPVNINDRRDNVDDSLVSFMEKLQLRIRHNWFPPKDCGYPVVAFSVLKSGELGKLIIVKTSGCGVGDNAALAAIRNSAPFPKFPQTSGDSLDIQFTFSEPLRERHGQFHSF